MPNVTFIAPDGARHDVDATEGISLMMAALTYGIDGILAECGGSLACGTCHVHVGPEHLDRLPPVLPAEAEILDALAGTRGADSRLACQLRLTAALDGLVVRVPAEQG